MQASINEHENLIEGGACRPAALPLTAIGIDSGL